MKCTSEEWDHCRVEKMGCTGCYYKNDKYSGTIETEVVKQIVEGAMKKAGFDVQELEEPKC